MSSCGAMAIVSPSLPSALMLAYLIEHAGRVVAQDEILEALWPETHVNPEVLRKYILEIRKALGDRPDNPEFIETVPSGDTGLSLP
jgi:DNA-binding winged helix-turn-helix (wHTH) protein